MSSALRPITCKYCAHWTITKTPKRFERFAPSPRYKGVKQAPLLAPTPPRLEKKEPEPLFKFSEEFREQALKNAADWLDREEHCELFGEEETKTYLEDFEKYKEEYMKCIQNLQQELSQINERTNVSKRSESEDDWLAKALVENAKWNEQIQNVKRSFDYSTVQTADGSSSQPPSVREERKSVLRLIERDDFVRKLVQTKSERLLNVVTEENLDERIDEALSGPIFDFNFAVDASGSVHEGVTFDRVKLREINERVSPALTTGFIKETRAFGGADELIEEDEMVAEDEGVLFQELDEIFQDTESESQKRAPEVEDDFDGSTDK